MSNQNPVPKLYKSIVDDVIQSCREIFLDDGVDEQILLELRQLWETKLNQSKAVDNMVHEPEHVISTQFALQQQQAQQQAAKLAAAALALQNNPFYHQSLIAQNIRASNLEISPSAAAAAMALPPQFYQHFQNVIGNASSLFKNSSAYRMGPVVHNLNEQPVHLPPIPSTSSFLTTSATNEDHIVQIDGTFDATYPGPDCSSSSIPQNIIPTRAPPRCPSDRGGAGFGRGKPVVVPDTFCLLDYNQLDGKYDDDDEDDDQENGASARSPKGYGNKRRRVDVGPEPVKETQSKSKASRKAKPVTKASAAAPANKTGPSPVTGSSGSNTKNGGGGPQQRKKKGARGGPTHQILDEDEAQGLSEDDLDLGTPLMTPGGEDDEDDDDEDRDELGYVGGGRRRRKGTGLGEDDDLIDEEEDDDLDNTPSSVRSQEEEPLNSQDDVSEEEPSDLFDTDNVVVCQFEKITRSRNKWKFYFKDGIMNINGKDYVFQRALGDAEW